MLIRFLRLLRWLHEPAVFATLLATGQVGAAQTTRPAYDALNPALAEILTHPLPLRDGIGIAHEAVTTSSPHAQAYPTAWMTRSSSFAGPTSSSSLTSKPTLLTKIRLKRCTRRFEAQLR